MGSSRGFLAALIIPAGAAAAISGDHRFPAPGAPPGPPRDAPTAVVALGDSTIAGEGAGSYEPGTDDQPRLLRGAVPAGWVRAGQAVHRTVPGRSAGRDRRDPPGGGRGRGDRSQRRARVLPRAHQLRQRVGATDHTRLRRGDRARPATPGRRGHAQGCPGAAGCSGGDADGGVPHRGLPARGADLRRTRRARRR